VFFSASVFLGTNKPTVLLQFCGVAVPSGDLGASSTVHQLCNISHFAALFQPFCNVISAILRCKFSHLSLLSQLYWLACAVLFSPTDIACDPKKMFFGSVCMQRYKILQAIARLSRIFFDRYGRQCFLQPKAEMPTTTKIKTFLRRNGDDGDSFYFFFFVFLFSCSLFFRNITN